MWGMEVVMFFKAVAAAGVYKVVAAAGVSEAVVVEERSDRRFVRHSSGLICKVLLYACGLPAALPCNSGGPTSSWLWLRCVPLAVAPLVMLFCVAHVGVCLKHVLP